MASYEAWRPGPHASGCEGHDRVRFGGLVALLTLVDDDHLGFLGTLAADQAAGLGVEGDASFSFLRTDLGRTSGAGSRATWPSMAMIISLGFLGSGPWKVKDRSRTSVPVGGSGSGGLGRTSSCPARAGSCGNGGGLVWLTMSLSACSENGVSLDLGSKPFAQLLERCLGDLDALDLRRWVSS